MRRFHAFPLVLMSVLLLAGAVVTLVVWAIVRAGDEGWGSWRILVI